MSKFLKGTFILLIAGFITRILGFINRIVIARCIGEEGVGLYMMAFPTFILVVTITQMGLPVAISKNVAEAEAKGDFAEIKKILVVSLVLTIGLSVIFTPALLLLAPFLSTTLFTDQRIYYPLIAVMTKAFIPYGIEYAAAAAMVSSVIGELVSLAYLMTTFKLKKRFKLRNNFFQFVQSGKETFHNLMEIAIPSMGSRMIGSVSWFFEPIVVAHSLAIAGVI